MMDHVAGTGGLQPWQHLPDGELRPALSGPGPAGTAALRAESVRMGQQIVVMQVWVEDAQGVRCAEGCYTFRCKPAEHKG